MKVRSKMIRILFAGFLFSVMIFPIVSFSSGETASSTNYPLFQQQPPATDAASAQIYQEKCATCHDKPVGRVPSRSAIALGSTEEIIQTMTTGSMKQFADGLTADQIRALTIYLTAEQANGPVRGKLHANPCKSTAGPITLGGPEWNGWGRDLENSRYQPKPGIKPEDVPRLKVKWAWTHPGPMATGQPTIIGDRLFVTTEVGQVYSLDAQTGCTYWTVSAGAGLRAAMSVGPLPSGSKAKFALYFGDQKSNVQAVDAATGELIWKTRVEDHVLSRITGSPLLYRDRIYVPVSSIEETTGRDLKYECCKFRGSLVALDAYTGT